MTDQRQIALTIMLVSFALRSTALRCGISVDQAHCDLILSGGTDNTLHDGTGWWWGTATDCSAPDSGGYGLCGLFYPQQMEVLPVVRSYSVLSLDPGILS